MVQHNTTYFVLTGWARVEQTVVSSCASKCCICYFCYMTKDLEVDVKDICQTLPKGPAIV